MCNTKYKMISKRNMFINVRISAIPLLHIYFLYTTVTAKDIFAHSWYAKHIMKQPIILTRESEFCQSTDVNLWVNPCRNALKQLLILKTFKDVYLNYNAFTPTAVTSKCQERSVELKEQLLYLYKDVMKYIQRTRKPEIKQHMATCHTRRAVISNDNLLKTERDIQETVAIMLLFRKKENSDKYIIYSVYSTGFHYQYNISPELFIQRPPTSIRTGLKKLFVDHEEIFKSPQSYNIVHWSDRFLFARLCLMALIRLHYYKHVNVDASSLCSQKPDALTKNVYFQKRPTELKFEVNVYPCVPTSDYRSILMNPIVEPWSFLQNVYALMKGPEDNSLIVLAHTKSSVDGSIILTPVEFIKNVHKEFLDEIYIPNNAKTKCDRNRYNSFRSHGSSSNPICV